MGATIARFGSKGFTDPFAHRRAAISAAKLGQFDRASLLFEQGAKQQNDGFEPTRVGLLIDASYCALRAGGGRHSGSPVRRCSALLTEAVLLLPPAAWAEGDKRWEAILQAANATAQLCENPGRLLADGKPFEISFGRASQPDLAVDESTPSQAMRVGLLKTQVAFLEAHWPDASAAIFDRVPVLLRGDDLFTRINGSKALLLRDRVGGTSPSLLRCVIGMSDVAGELHARRGAPGTSTVMAEDLLSGVLAVGLLLSSAKSNELLERLLVEARDANKVDVTPILNPSPSRPHHGAERRRS